MVQLAAATYGFDVATAEEYLSDYTDEELRTLMREQLVSAVKRNMPTKPKPKSCRLFSNIPHRTIFSARPDMPQLRIF